MVDPHEIVLSFYCARSDADAVVEAIRAVAGVPVHERDESVHGHDFDDAGTAEQVTGELRRAAIELRIAAERLEDVVAAVRAARRRLPVRWHAVAVLSAGRFA